YQWLFNGSPLPGRIAAAFSLNNVQQTNAGAYSVIVTNPFGSVTSAVATLTVKLPPPCTPVLPGLISWWRFEGNLLDGWNDNNGISIPLLNPSLFGAGMVGQAFNTAGSRFVRIPSSPSLRITNTFPLEAWVNPANLSGPMPRTIIAR